MTSTAGSGMHRSFVRGPLRLRVRTAANRSRGIAKIIGGDDDEIDDSGSGVTAVAVMAPGRIAHGLVCWVTRSRSAPRIDSPNVWQYRRIGYGPKHFEGGPAS